MHRSSTYICALTLVAALASACTDKSGDTSEDSTSGATTEAATDSATGEPTTGAPAGQCEGYVTWALACGTVMPADEADEIDYCEESRRFDAFVYGEACAEMFDTAIACTVAAECGQEGMCSATSEPGTLPEPACEVTPGASCEAYAAALVGCGAEDEPSGLSRDCQLDINLNAYQSAACGMAKESLYACVGGLTCAQLDDETSCAAEGAMIDVACPADNGAPARPGAPRRAGHRD